LKITSPAAQDIIAVTDPHYLNPQAGPNERRPAHRKLTVEGTAPNGVSTVNVNGVQAPVVNGGWTAKIPADLTGALTLKASAAGQEDSVPITLIDLQITTPKENDSLPLGTGPAIPDVMGQVAVPGFAGDITSVAFNWTLDARGRWVKPVKVNGNKQPYWQDYTEPVAHGSTTGTKLAWSPQAGTIVGGVGRLVVTANLPGVKDNPVTSDPRWIDLPGANPDLADAKAFVDQHEPTYANTVRHIFCWESWHHTWNQFSPKANSAEGKTTNIPADWSPTQPNPGRLRPQYGFPAGVGVAQLDPADFPSQQWDWQANELRGIALFHEKLSAARAWSGREQSRLDHRRAAVLAAVKAPRAAQHLPPLVIARIIVPALSVDQPLVIARIIVPALSVDQVLRDAIRAYNGGHQYRFNADYVIDANGTTVTRTGMPQWVEGPGLRWKAAADLKKPSSWVPVAAANKNYVKNVLTCKNS